MRPVLTPDSPEATVVRRLAAHVFGGWKVTWPDDYPEELKPKVPEDRELGYVANLKTAQLGRMERRFTRADVSITAAEIHDGKPVELTGLSDVEQTLDEAHDRTDNKTFFERDITRAGLNGWIPREDFTVGDLVDIDIWGKLVKGVPVTSIEAVTDNGAIIDWKIHVGGQVISDDQARRADNRELDVLIARERREREQSVSSVSRTVASVSSSVGVLAGDVSSVGSRVSSVESKLAPTDAVSQALVYARQGLDQAKAWTPQVQQTVEALKAELEKTPENVVAQGTAMSLGLNLLSMQIHSAHQTAMEGLAAQQGTLESQQKKLESQSSDLWWQQRRLKTAQDDLALVQKRIVHQQPEVLYCGGNSSASGSKGSVSTTWRNVTARFSSGYYGTIAIAVQAYATKNFTFFRSGRGYSLSTGTANAGEDIGSVLVFFFPENEPK